MITKIGAAVAGGKPPILPNFFKHKTTWPLAPIYLAGKAGIWGVKNGAKAAAGTAKFLYGGPKRCMFTVPASFIAATRFDDYFNAPSEYVNPMNNRFQLDDGIFMNGYTKGPDYERYTRVC